MTQTFNLTCPAENWKRAWRLGGDRREPLLVPDVRQDSRYVWMERATRSG
jgi:hypothetical protein